VYVERRDLEQIGLEPSAAPKKQKTATHEVLPGRTRKWQPGAPRAGTIQIWTIRCWFGINPAYDARPLLLASNSRVRNATLQLDRRTKFNFLHLAAGCRRRFQPVPRQ